MPRKPRLFLPDCPQHIVARGHSKRSIFFSPTDYRCFYRYVRDAARKHQIAVHAWVFMQNHIHLLVTPSNAASIPRAMQSIGRRYAYYCNARSNRRGTLWEDRYKSILIDSERYLFACYRYIELNPVSASLVRIPGDYPYSSFHSNALGKPDSLITPHSLYLALGDEETRHTNYRCLFDKVLSKEEKAAVRT